MNVEELETRVERGEKDKVVVQMVQSQSVPQQKMQQNMLQGTSDAEGRCNNRCPEKGFDFDGVAKDVAAIDNLWRKMCHENAACPGA